MWMSALQVVATTHSFFKGPRFAIAGFQIKGDMWS